MWNLKVEDSLSLKMQLLQLANANINETGSRLPCMRPRSDPPNFGPIERGEKQTNNID